MPQIPNSFTMQRRFAGLDVFSAAAEISEYDLAETTNMFPYGGYMYTRLGKVSCFVAAPSSNPSYQLATFLRSDGTTSIVFVNNGKLYHTVPGPIPMTYAEIQIGGSVSFSLVSANARAAHIGKYLYIVDGVVSLYRVNINSDNTYTAVAVTALSPPSVPSSPALTYTTIDAFTSTTGWSADYIAGTVAAKTITGVTNATPMVVTSASHGYSANDVVNISGVVGTTAANGTWLVGTVATNTFQLLYMDGSNSTGNAGYTSGGSAVRLGTTTNLSAVGATNLLPQQGQYLSWSSVGSAGGGWTPVTGPLDTPRGSFDTTATMPGSPSDFDPGVKYIQMDNPPSSFRLTTAVPNVQLVNDKSRYATHFLVQLTMIASTTDDSIDVAVSAYSDTAGTNLLSVRTVNLATTSIGYHLVTLANVVAFGDVDTAIRSLGVSYTAGAKNHPGDNGPWISRLALYPIVGNGNTATPGAVAFASASTGHVSVDARLLTPLNIAPMVSTAQVGGMRLSKDFIAVGATAKTITGAADSGGVLQVTSASHGYSNGDLIIIHDVLGNTAANGVFYVGGVATNTFKLYTDSGLTTGVTTNATYISGGTAIKALATSFASYSHTAIVVNPISTITGLRFRLGLTNSTGTAFTNEAVVQADGVTYAIDVSSLTSAQLTGIAQVSIVFISDIAIGSDGAALFALGPFTSAGNLTIGDVDYVIVAAEAQDTSVDTAGASTGITTDGVVLSDPSPPTTPVLTPTVTAAQYQLSAAAWTNASANYVYFFRFGGVLPTGNTPFTDFALVAKCPRWTGGTHGATGWTWNGTDTWTSTDGYCTWNPTTRVFTDNTPDLALIGADVLVRGRTAPPTGATAVCGYNNRVGLAKDSTFYLSNLLTTDAAAGLYFPATVDPTDPNAVIKGAQIPVFSNSGDKIQNVVATDQYVAIFKSKSVNILTGTDPVSGFQLSTHLRDAGIGLTAPRGYALYQDHIVFQGPNAVYEYIGAERADKMSTKIEPLIAPGLTGGTAIGATYYAGGSMRFAQQRLWWFMPTSGDTANTVAYVYDTHRYTPQEPALGWTKYTNFTVTGAASLSGGNDTDDLYFLGNAGNMFKYQGNYDVNSITAVTAATNATPIVITSASHGLSSGDRVYVSGVGGNTAANGTFYATVSDSSHFSLYSDSARTVGVAGNGSYTSGGACGKMVAITATPKSRGLMQDGSDRNAMRTNRPTRAYAVLTTTESVDVTMTVSAVGYPSTVSKTFTISGESAEIRWKVPSELRGNAVQVALSWSAYSQVKLQSLGVEGAEGAIRGGNG